MHLERKNNNMNLMQSIDVKIEINLIFRVGAIYGRICNVIYLVGGDAAAASWLALVPMVRCGNSFQGGDF